MNTQAQVFWFTGLSGAGKSTVSELVRAELEGRGHRVLVLDGDDVRSGLHRNLGFTVADILTNNALIADLCATNRHLYDLILVPIISPFKTFRRAAKERLGDGFHEIYCDAGLDIVSARDTKGLYARGRRGELANVIGLSTDVPYEAPDAPHLRLRTGEESAVESSKKLLAYVLSVVGRSDSHGTRKPPEQS